MFAFFLVSGFCSLAYEVIWLRLAMAGFGVTTPLVSIVLSVFMGGLGLGSWLGGGSRARSSRAARARAALLCAHRARDRDLGARVPYELQYGQRLLAARRRGRLGLGRAPSRAGAWIALTLLPFCTAMGATFPLGIAALRRASPEPRSARSATSTARTRSARARRAGLGVRR
jgi:hypothetical protein